jgi:hypothetical protein
MTDNRPGPGRPSSLSRHPEREAITVAILDGEGIPAISATYGLASRSLRRSAANLRAQARASAEEAELVTVSTLAASFVDVALDARAARVEATEAGDRRARIQAQRSEAQALKDLASTLGITDTSVLEDLSEAEAIVITVRRVLAEFGAPLARALSKAALREGYDELAETFTSVADFYTKNPPTRRSTS